MHKRSSVWIPLWVLVFLAFGFAPPRVTAQVPDAQIKKDLTHAKTVSVTLGAAGKREWSSTYKKYIWTRDFTAKLKTDDPEVFVLVKGYAAYDLIGGRSVFWRTFTTSNSYEGIPDPTASEVQSLIGRFGVEKVMGQYHFNHVIGKIESLSLAAEPKFEWHTPNSVSFNVIAIYTERINDIGGREKVAQTFRIRLYRDSPKADWKNLLSTPENRKVL